MDMILDRENFTELEYKIMSLFKTNKNNTDNKKISKDIIISTFIDSYSLEEIEETLKTLEVNGYLYLNGPKEYQLLSKCSQLKIGEVKYNSKSQYFYVVCGKSVLKILSKHLNGALPGDVVIVKQTTKNGTTIMEVEKIVKRSNTGIVFDYVNGIFVPVNCDTKIRIHIPENQLKKLVHGTRVLVKVALDKTDRKYNGQIVSIVGHKDDPHLDIKTIASNKGASIDFSDEAMAQAEAISTEVTQEDIDERLANGGIDLRKKTIFTIDGENTKDIDDAVSIERLPNGNYLLGVHIADVSHYVEEDSPLDLEARERSTSIYPYNYVIPMLPHKLSNGICSLNPNVDRLALSCFIEIDPTGDIVNYHFNNSIINSKKKMSYEKINDIFERGIMHDDYEPFLGDLTMMMELAHILNQRKIDRGYISFGDDDIKFVDDNGKPLEIRKRVRGAAEKMIEDFMLTANNVTATMTDNFDIPAIYRNHPAPNPDSVKAILEMLKINMNISNHIDNPRKMQEIIHKIQKMDESGVCLDLLLQSMKRAYYSTNNIGHFGLAFDDYTHETSPIRRYPDLATHRIIKAIIGGYIDEYMVGLNKKLTYIAQNSSAKQRIADSIEKEAALYKMAEWMESHIGESFVAYVTYTSKNGLTLRTENMISGKISAEQLRNAGFTFNQAKNLLINTEDDTTLGLGDKIWVTVKAADKELCKIDFEFIQKLEHAKIKSLKAV
jgi:ribonuclease R